MLDSMPRLVGLLTQDLLVERHHNQVIKVVAKTRVRQHSNNVGKIIELVFGEELIVQVETAEDHVHLRHVVVIVTVERVVQNRDIWPRGIQQSKILKTASAEYVWKQAVKELQITLAVEDHHRNLVTLTRRPDAAGKVLRDDVAQQRCFSRSRLPENNTLHDANS